MSAALTRSSLPNNFGDLYLKLLERSVSGGKCWQFRRTTVGSIRAPENSLSTSTTTTVIVFGVCCLPSARMLQWKKNRWVGCLGECQSHFSVVMTGGYIVPGRPLV